MQTRGTLLYTYGVETGKITREQMCALLSENPARLYGVYPRKGAIRPGSDADIVVLDPEEKSVISARHPMPITQTIILLKVLNCTVALTKFF